MPKDTKAPSSPSFKKTRLLLASSWNNIADLKVVDGVKDLVAVGGNAIASTAIGVTSFIKVKTDMDNLSAAQKIVPYVMIGVSVPVTVSAMVVTVAGLSTIAPPFMFAASIATMTRSVATLIADKRSLDNLNKQLITQDKVFKVINKSKLSAEQKQVALNYVDLPEKIYAGLYSLRQNIIERPDLTTEQKNTLIKSVNAEVENFHAGKTSAIDFDNLTRQMPLAPSASEEISKRLHVINAQMKEYTNAKDKFDELPIKSDLKKKIKYFKKTHEHIYAQDLSPKTKQKMIDILNQSKIGHSDMKTMYAMMANHFVNTHSETQRVALDKTMVGYIKESNSQIDQKQTQALEQYLALPREIYNEIKKIHDDLPQDKQEAFRRAVIDEIKKNPDSLMEFVPGSIVSFLRENQIDAAGFTENINNINGLKEKAAQIEISAIERESPDTKGTVLAEHRISKIELPEKDIAFLNQHRNALLIDQIQTGNISVESPQVSDPNFMKPPSLKDTKVGKYVDDKVGRHIAEKAEYLKEKITKPFENIAVKAKTKLMEKYYGKEKAAEVMARKQSKKEARSEFHAQFDDAHVFLHNAEERNFLKKAVVRDVANVGLTFLNVLVTGVSSIALPVLFSPGAPAAAGVALGLGVVSTGLVVAAVANSAELMVEHQRSVDKTYSANRTAARSATPDVAKEVKLTDDLREVQTRKDQRKQEKQEAKQAKQEAKQVKQEEKEAKQKLKQEERALLAAQHPKEEKHRVLTFSNVYKKGGFKQSEKPQAEPEARRKAKPGRNSLSS